MALLDCTVDVIFIILQYFNPIGRDILNFKVVCSSFKELVENFVPMHHIISIFLSIANNNPHTPTLVLPSDFVLKDSTFLKFFSLLDQKMQQEHFSSHLVTRFFLLYHNHPMSMQFLRLTHNSAFLLQLATENYFPESPAFQQLRTIHRLKSMIMNAKLLHDEKDNRETYVQPKWVKEKEWSAAFLTPFSLHREFFIGEIVIPKDEELIHGIIENKGLLLFLVAMTDLNERTTLSTLFDYLFAHPKWQEYKLDLHVQKMLAYYCMWGDEKRLAKELLLSECKDEKYLMTLLDQNRYLLQHFSPELRKNERFLTALVRRDVYLIFFAEKELQKNIIREMCRLKRYNISELQLLIPFYKHDGEFFQEVTLFIDNILINLSREQALIEVSQNRSIFTNKLHRHWSHDREIVLAAVRSNGRALQFASNELKNDEGVVVAALLEDPTAIQYASEPIQVKFKKDRELLLQLTKYKFYTVNVFDETFRDDLEIMLEALRTNSCIFKDASQRIQQDIFCVSQVLESNGCCFRYLSKELQVNEEFLHISVQSNPAVIEYLPKELQEKREIMQLRKQFYGIDA